MLRRQFHRSISIVGLVLAVGLTLSAGYNIYRDIRQEHPLESLHESTTALALSIQRRATAVLGYVNRPDVETRAAVENVTDGTIGIEPLESLEESFDAASPIPLRRLKSDTAALQALGTELMNVTDLKRRLLAEFEKLLQQVDAYLEERNMPQSLLDDPFKTRTALKLEIKLAKVAREMGLYLKLGYSSDLAQLDAYVAAYQAWLNKLSGQLVAEEERQWLQRLQQLIEEKHEVVNRITGLVRQKNQLLDRYLLLFADLQQALAADTLGILDEADMLAERERLYGMGMGGRWLR